MIRVLLLSFVPHTYTHTIWIFLTLRKFSFIFIFLFATDVVFPLFCFTSNADERIIMARKIEDQNGSDVKKQKLLYNFFIHRYRFFPFSLIAAMKMSVSKNVLFSYRGKCFCLHSRIKIAFSRKLDEKCMSICWRKANVMSGFCIKINIGLKIGDRF